MVNENNEKVTWVMNPKNIENWRVVQDYDEILEALNNGEEVFHWENGTSMQPMLRHREYCHIRPIRENEEIKPGDAVFCRVNGCLMVHMVWLTSNASHNGVKTYLIGSSGGSLYGWTDEVYGIAQGTSYFNSYSSEELAEAETNVNTCLDVDTSVSVDE